MDIAIVIGHLIISLLYFSFAIPNSVLVVVFTTLWYLFIDRILLNIFLAVPARLIIVLLGESGGKNVATTSTLWIELFKAPISAGLGGYILLYLFKSDAILVPFAIGLLLWSFNFHFIGGVFKHHPYNLPMFIGVLILTSLTIGLLLSY